MNTIVVFFGLLAFPLVAAGEVVIACDVGSGPRIRLEVIRETPIADTHVYLLRQNGKSTPVFSDIDGSRGAAVSALCVGRKNGALVFSGEFTANAVQGFVLTYKPQNQKVGRLDFAEKSVRNGFSLARMKQLSSSRPTVVEKHPKNLSLTEPRRAATLHLLARVSTSFPARMDTKKSTWTP